MSNTLTGLIPTIYTALPRGAYSDEDISKIKDMIELCSA